MILDEVQLNALKPADRAAYMTLEGLFASKGWKYLKQLAEARREEQLRNAALASTWEQNRACVGNAAAWDSLSKLEEETANVYLGKIEEQQRHAAELSLTEETQYE